jgi:RNA polymerase sigma factor (sigma-70 family)
MIIEDLIGRQLSGYLGSGIGDIGEELDQAIDLDRFLLTGKRECIVLMMLIRGYTQDEISNCLGITRMTVSRDVKRARAQLKKRI